MIFTISRTSVRNDETKPHEKAFRLKAPEHTTTPDGYIKRRVDDVEEWCVEVDSLEELLHLAGEGEIIVSGGDVPSIEIYDDYRE